MISDFQGFVQDHDVASFLQVFVGVGIIIALIYAVRALLRPASVVRSSGPAVFRGPTVTRSRAVKPTRPLQGQTNPKDLDGPRLALLMLPAEMHWQRAIAPMQSSIARGKRARDFHERAAMRLDAADYAFDRMLEELSSVLTLPGRSAASGSFGMSALSMDAGPASLAA